MFIEKISGELKSIGSEDFCNENEKDDITEIVSIREHMLSLLDRVKDASKLIAFRQLSAQVAHDIRSPLVVLDIVTKDLRRRNALSPEMGKITISESHLTRGGYPVIIGTLIQPFTESMTQGITQISELTYLRGRTITQALILLQLGIRAVIRNS